MRGAAPRGAGSGLTCALAAFITGIVLFAVSFSILTPHEYGIEYNSVSYKIEGEVQSECRCFIGPGHRFFKVAARRGSLPAPGARH